MTAQATAPSSSAAPSSFTWRPWHSLLLLTLAALALRWPDFGNPYYSLDDNFYLLVGERMHMGDLPYVDIWDRKPLGLFLIYWLAAFFGTGLYAAQLFAGLAALATAGIIARITRRLTGNEPAAAVSGLIYLTAILPLWGNGGQSPIFYNPLVAAVALLSLDALHSTDRQRIERRASLAMLLAGLAIFIKQPAMFECGYFAAISLYRLRALGLSTRQLIARAIAYAALAILPTFAGFAGYALAGHGGAYADATILSIFRKSPLSAGHLERQLLFLAANIAPLAIMAAIGAWRARRGERTEWRWLIGWTIAALIGFLSVPNFFHHYALPLCVPFAILAAIAIFGMGDTARPGIPAVVAGAVLLVWPLVIGMAASARARTIANQNASAIAARTIAEHLNGGCLVMFGGPPLLYQQSGSCIPTRLPFFEHLVGANEERATGIDQMAETNRLLALHPGVITEWEGFNLRQPNYPVFARYRAVLAREYAPGPRIIFEETYSRPAMRIWIRKSDPQ